MLSFQRTAPPIVEPVPLALAKQQLRVDFPDDDVLIAGYITAAREWAEVYTRRAFFNQSFVLSLDAFPPACNAAAFFPLGSAAAGWGGVRSPWGGPGLGTEARINN